MDATERLSQLNKALELQMKMLDLSKEEVQLKLNLASKHSTKEELDVINRAMPSINTTLSKALKGENVDADISNIGEAFKAMSKNKK